MGVEYFVETLGMDVKLACDGFNGSQPVHWAASNAGMEVIDYLVSKGAEINAEDDNGNTPLHFAASKESPAGLGIVRFLVDRGGDLDRREHKGYSARKMLHMRGGEFAQYARNPAAWRPKKSQKRTK